MKCTPGEWLAHYGEERNKKRIAESIARNRGNYKARLEPGGLWQFPAWEMDFAWDESEYDWPRRWQECGGKIYAEGRLIALKTSPVWGLLSNTFPDGLGNPYPPFIPLSWVTLLRVGRKETLVLGVASGEELAIQSGHVYKPKLTEEVDLDKLSPELKAKLLKELTN